AAGVADVRVRGTRDGQVHVEFPGAAHGAIRLCESRSKRAEARPAYSASSLREPAPCAAPGTLSLRRPQEGTAMSERIVIDPVTRIEGHAKITINLDDAGKVNNARFHVTEFRGFERFCVGRPFHEMPGLTARICGICPVSHILASSKAGDRILAVSVPPAGE